MRCDQVGTNSLSLQHERSPDLRWTSARESFHGDRPALALDERAPELLTDPNVLHEHLDRMGSAVAKHPAVAVHHRRSCSKVFCKIIIDRAGETYTRNDDLPALYKQVSTLLAIRSESVP
jgi:hypothetical protein